MDSLDGRSAGDRAGGIGVRWWRELLRPCRPRSLIPLRSGGLWSYPFPPLFFTFSPSSSLAAFTSRSRIQLLMDRPSWSAARWNKSLSSGEMRMSSRTDFSPIQTVYSRPPHISTKISLDFVQTCAVRCSCQSETKPWTPPLPQPRPCRAAATAAGRRLDGARTGLRIRAVTVRRASSPCRLSRPSRLEPCASVWRRLLSVSRF